MRAGFPGLVWPESGLSRQLACKGPRPNNFVIIKNILAAAGLVLFVRTPLRGEREARAKGSEKSLGPPRLSNLFVKIITDLDTESNPRFDLRPDPIIEASFNMWPLGATSGTANYRI